MLCEESTVMRVQRSCVSESLNSRILMNFHDDPSSAFYNITLVALLSRKRTMFTTVSTLR